MGTVSSARAVAVASVFTIPVLLTAIVPADAVLAVSRSGPTSNVACVHNVCTATGANASLSTSWLQKHLANANVKVISGSLANDIELDSTLTWVSSRTLTLDAYRSITIRKPVSVAGAGGLTLLTNDGGTGGIFSFNASGKVTFWNLTSALTINSAPYTLVGDIASLASDVASKPNNNYALANNYDASADGTYSDPPIINFGGIFEGLGNAISNLTIHDPEVHDAVGLIAYLQSTGTVQHLALKQESVSGVSGYVGGLIGSNVGVVSNDYVGGNVSGPGEGRVGGLVGANFGSIDKSWTTAAISGGDHSDIGGLVGENFHTTSTISNSYATGKILSNTGTGGSYIGGLVGLNQGGVLASYATGNVVGQVFVSNTMGGLAGANSGSIEASYATGSMTGKGTVGGLIGVDGPVSITHTYWDTTTSSITNLSQGSGNIANDPGITGLTTSQLQSGLPTGFDPAIWGENGSINNGLPFLLAHPPR